MNNDNKDEDCLSLLSRLGNGSKRTRREHKEMAMDMHSTIKQITRRGGVVGDDDDEDVHEDNDDETTTMKPRSDRGCGGGEWRAAAMAVAVATRG